ncbi:MAG: hypothetical protein QXR26_07100 [Candidatus Caldarchaeum sp.]
MSISWIAQLLTALCLSVVLFIPSVSGQSPDIITVSTGHSVYTLGEMIEIRAVFKGATHGTITLTLTDPWGTVVRSWSWEHLGGDSYEARATHVARDPGRYVIRAVHVGHHGEPSVQDSRAVSVWSAKIAGLEYPGYVAVERQFDVKAIVKYTFNEETTITLGIWDINSKSWAVKTNDTLSGTGIKEYVLTLKSANTPTIMNLSARVEYMVPGRGWLHDATRDWYIDFTVPVSIKFITTTIAQPITYTTTVTTRILQTIESTVTQVKINPTTLTTVQMITFTKTVERTTILQARDNTLIWWLAAIVFTVAGGGC